MWQSWAAHRGESGDERVARSKFTADRFEPSAKHCIFAEHETIGSDGQPRKYTVRELTKIVRQHGREARDIGAFPAIASHHTPDRTDPHGKEPDVLGYCGPMRLGMIGRENPRWAIFADEYHLRDSKQVLNTKPYRSVELWTFKDGRMRFHPVAAVGAEAPRLQMPAKYSQGQFTVLPHEGATVEKYTVAAMAAGSNTFTKEPVQYTADKDSAMEADLPKLMAMLQETPQFKFLTRMMEEYEAEKASTNPAPTAGAPPVSPPTGAAEQFTIKPDDDPDDLDDLLNDSFALAPKKPGEEPEKHTVKTDPNVVSIDKYNQLHASHQSLIKHTKQLHERTATIERRAVDADRREKINSLAAKFPMLVDAEDEAKLCLYSLGSSMSDDQFSHHFATIEKYAEKMAHSPMVPRGALPERSIAQSEVERYEARLSQEAVKVHGEYLAQGKSPDWNTCEAEAKKRLGLK